MAAEMSGPDPTLYLYTSLTAGSSHIITATSRLETILKANKIAFRAIDCATDEKARNLWSRKSKNKKLPGLVKYGLVIGDLNEVEEWNEYGEIKEQIDNVSDLFGDTPMTDTPMPPPEPITLKDPINKVYESPSRSSSKNRHISISDPKDKDGSGYPSVKASKDDSPLNAAMRQAGAEAAAKAGQRKTSATTTSKSAATGSALPAKRDSTETTPTAAATKMSVEAADPADATEITAAKTPAQLAAQGAKKTSVDKIAESGTDSQSTSDSESDSKSTEEQVLEARRESSIAKKPSRLAQETSIDEMKSPVSEEAVASETNLPTTSPSRPDMRPTHHRGSSLSEASKEEIKAIEEANAIKEVPEEDASDHESSSKLKTSTSKSTIQATDKAEAEVMKGSKPQDQKAKDADAAGVSAAALFLSPNHDPNPNRLSADSASVYSFFDSAFNPAPLFSGSKTLDLDLSFMNDLGKSDTRASISTYASKYDEDEENGEEQKNIVNSVRTSNHANQDETPKQSMDTQRSTQNQEKSRSPEGSPQRDIIPSLPVIAPLRTPARRLVSEPLPSNRVSTPTSVPLPLNIRKTPTDPSLTPPSRPQEQQIQTTQPTRSQPSIQTRLPYPPSTTTLRSPPSTNSLITSPTSLLSDSTPQSPSPSTPLTPQSQSSVQGPESRTLRFKKSIRSLRSKKSTQRLNSPSPTEPLPPNLPAQRQLKDLGIVGMRSVSDSYAVKEKKQQRERGKLLCF